MPISWPRGAWLALGALVLCSSAPFELALKVFPELEASPALKRALVAALYGPPFVWALVALWRRRSGLRPHTADLPLLALVAWATASLVWSQLPGRTALEVARLVGFVAVGREVAMLGPRRAFELLAVASAGLGIFGVGLAVGLPGLGTETRELHFGAWTGPFLHKNTFGVICALGGVLCLGEVVLFRRWRWLLPVGVCGLGLALSRSVGSLALAVIGTGVFAGAALVQAWRLVPRIARRRYSAGAALGGLLVMVGLFVAGGHREILSLVDRDLTFSNRTVVWEALLPHVQEQWLLGHGFHGFWRSERASAVRFMFGIDNGYAHNAALQVLLDLGVVGLVLALIQVVFAVYGWTRSEKGPARVLAAAVIVVVSAHNAVEVSYLMTSSTGLLWLGWIVVSYGSSLGREHAGESSAAPGEGQAGLGDSYPKAG